MDSKAVSKEIRARVWPQLKSAGFSIFTARTAWRDSDDEVDVVNLQSYSAYNAEVLGVTSFSFSVNLGTFLKYVPTRWPPKMKGDCMIPSEAECQFRRRLTRSISQSDNEHVDVWSVDKQGRNLLWCIQDVVEHVPDALTWFARLKDKSEVLNILLNEEENMHAVWGIGRRPSPLRAYLTGYLALSEGKHGLAHENLEEAVKSNCFSDEFTSVNDAIRLFVAHRRKS